MKRHAEALISRQSWLATRAYLDYCRDVRQCADGSVELYRVALDWLLRWARDVPLQRSGALRPVFPRFLEGFNLSATYRKKLCSIVRDYFRWAKGRHSKLYAKVAEEWIESIKPAKGPERVRERKLYAIEDVRALVAAPTERLIDERDRAAAAFLFLSGMRDAAFCSMPVAAVALTPGPGMVKQWPALGVRTKNGKAANTFLLNIPDLLDVVSAWDARVRGELGPDGLWFAQMNGLGMAFDLERPAGENRSFARRLKRLCGRAGLAYLSPHKLRHGHAVWALQHAAGVGDLKAISQNLMHSSIATTDRIYGELAAQDVRDRIAGLVERGGGEVPVDLAAQLFRMLQAD